ncbi:hypothetical protein D8S78_03470 [Natrialba swarupiae]|nr:hypothetical protein [Natrialba swarupiae]
MGRPESESRSGPTTSVRVDWWRPEHSGNVGRRRDDRNRRRTCRGDTQSRAVSDRHTPASSSDIYELLSTIRALDHTVARLTVSRDGPLEGEFVGWLSGTVVGLVRNDETIPFRPSRYPLRPTTTCISSERLLTSIVSR